MDGALLIMNYVQQGMREESIMAYLRGGTFMLTVLAMLAWLTLKNEK
jgi:hypothetical protein